MALSALSARLCAPCCSSSRPRATAQRLSSSASRRKTEPCHASLGDASFPFLPKKKDDDNDEDEDGPSLVPLDPGSASLLPTSTSPEEGYDSDGLFGPLALLAVGLEPRALRALAALLEDDLGARGVVPAFAAAEAMLELDLCSAVEQALLSSGGRGDGGELCLFRNSSLSTSPSSSKKDTAIAPRSSVERPAVVLSGMSSPEVVSIVSAWRDSSGFAASEGKSQGEDVLFCAAVPANWRNRTLRQLVEDIAGDAAAVEGKRGGK